MHWNYRVIQKKLDFNSKFIQKNWYEVKEVYYEDGDSSIGISEKPITICGESKEDIVKVLKMILNDIEKTDIIKEEDIL